MRDHLLAIDNGTQSVRALWFDLSGNLVAKSQVTIEPYFRASPAGPNRILNIMELTLRRLPAAVGQGAGGKRCHCRVALTTQRATVINVDARGARCAPPSSGWISGARGQRPFVVPGAWHSRLARMDETVAISRRRRRPTGSGRTSRDLGRDLQVSLSLRLPDLPLCGRFADSVGCQVGFMPFGLQAAAVGGVGTGSGGPCRCRASFSWTWCRPSGQIGAISTEAAAATGIPAGLP